TSRNHESRLARNSWFSYIRSALNVAPFSNIRAAWTMLLTGSAMNATWLKGSGNNPPPYRFTPQAEVKTPTEVNIWYSAFSVMGYTSAGIPYAEMVWVELGTSNWGLRVRYLA